jgi:hypothetical protein
MTKASGQGAPEPSHQPTQDQRHVANIEANSRAIDDKLGLTTGGLRDVAKDVLTSRKGGRRN